VPGTSRTYAVERYNHGDIYDARKHFSREFWEKTIDDAIQKAKDEGGWMPEAKAKAIKGLMERWRIEKVAKEQVQQETEVETAEVDS
jgi:hypothetical protein